MAFHLPKNVTKELKKKTTLFGAVCMILLTTLPDMSVCVQECTPFAVIGSNTVVEARGQRVRGRLYPWGIVEGTTAHFEHGAIQAAGFYIPPSCPSSGEPVSLRLCEAEEHADPLAHARPQRRDLRRALRKLQSKLHSGNDQVLCSAFS